MKEKILESHGEELASVEDGDILRTVRSIYKYEGKYYQTEHEEEGITGERYEGIIIAISDTLDGLRDIADPNVIDELVDIAIDEE